MTLGSRATVCAISALLIGCSSAKNELPLVRIDHPAQGQRFIEGEEVPFEAEVYDAEDDAPALSIRWESDLEGVLNTDPADANGGLAFSTTGLSQGEHTLTLTATDTAGESGADTLSFHVNDPELSIVVNSTEDAADADCGDPGGTCTLRAALFEADNHGGHTTITFAPEVTPGTFTLTQQATAEDHYAVGDLDVENAHLTIIGAGADQTILDGGGIDRVMEVGVPSTVTLQGLTIQNGHASTAPGGGMLNHGTLTVESCRIIDNRVDEPEDGFEGGGGGLFNFGTVTLVDTTIAGNVATGPGGGLHTSGPDAVATLVGCTVHDNSAVEADARGGGVATLGGTLTITNSTISGNTAEGEAGGILAEEDVTLIHATVFDNVSLTGTSGNGLHNEARAELFGTIIASSAPGDDCTGGGTFASNGANLDGDDTCGLTATGDVPAVDPLLGPLQDNGGPTETHALLPGSPAIDAIPASECDLAADQRGVARPQGPACDMGSYEAD
jgi:CSLREA domain-containing protein